MRDPTWRWLQALIGAAILGRSILSYLRGAGLEPLQPVVWQPHAIILLKALLAILAACLLMAWAWRELSRGWRIRVTVPDAIRAWALGHYRRLSPFHRKVMARLFADAEDAGVPSSSAPGAAVMPHLLTIATGVVVAMALIALSRLSWLGPFPMLGLPIAVIVLVAAVGLTSPSVAWRIGWELERPDGVQPVEPESLGAAMFANLVAWAGLGLGVQMLAQGAFNDMDLPWALATGAYAAAWVGGAVFRFLPGGIGVREGIFFVLVKSTIGPGPALALAVVARLATMLAKGLLLSLSFLRRSPVRDAS